MEKTDLDDSVLLDSILDEALSSVRRGEIVETEDYCRRYPEQADELRLMLPALAMLELPNQGSITSDSTKTLGERPIQPNLADFRIISEIGRGAMGVVYEAIQEPLGRRVALKVMRRGEKTNASQSLRFQREAEIAASLHHTNIVPVFDAGESEEFVYYAMQLIEGSNLQQLIASKGLRQAGKPCGSRNDKQDGPLIDQASQTDNTVVKFGSTEKDLQPEVTEKQLRHRPVDVELSPQISARIALQVAEGLEFANNRGILHRDIKPSNIMLDQDGRAWIADFGLAKDNEGVALTETGDVVGTVRYLAPERFRGQGDPRSDIYALGLTLFEALEGKPAFAENDRARLISRILAGTVSAFTVRVPRDLATICRKCIQQAPADRYATAGELAADLRRYLDGRPITAKPLSWPTRLFRKCGRNPLVSGLTALVFLVTVAGMVASWQNSKQLKNVTAESNAKARLADLNHLELLKTVDRFCQMVGADRRVYRDDFQDLRELLLESANELSAQSAGQSSLSESSRLSLARIFQRIGKMRTSDDKLVDSENYLIQARDLLEGLTPETREEPAVMIELAGTHRQLATVYRQMRESTSAHDNVQESVRLLELLLERDGLVNEEVGAAQEELARTYSVLGENLFEMRQMNEAESAMMRSLQIWESRLIAEPKNPDSAFELATQLTRLGSLLVGNIKKWKEAEKPLDEAIHLFKTLAEVTPEHPDLDFWQAQTLTKKARWFYMARQIENAINIQRSSIAIFDNLHHQFALDLAVQQEIGISLRQLAEFLSVQDPRNPEILSVLDRSEQILSLAVAGDPKNLGNVMTQLKTFQAQADFLRQIDDKRQALEKVDLVIATLERILLQEPGDIRAKQEQYFASVDRAELLTELLRHDEALVEWEVALKTAPAEFVEIVRMNRTRTIAMAGRHREATEQAEAILASLHPGSKPNQHLLSLSAVTFAVAAKVVLEEQESLDSRVESERYARRAMELLMSSPNSRGNVAQLIKVREEFRFLADRPDVQALLRVDDR